MLKATKPEILMSRPEAYTYEEAALSAAEILCVHPSWEGFMAERQRMIEDAGTAVFSAVWDRFLSDGTCLTVYDATHRPEDCRFLLLDPHASQVSFEQPVTAIAYNPSTQGFGGPVRYEPAWYFGGSETRACLQNREKINLETLCTYEDVVRESLSQRIYARQQSTCGYVIKDGAGFLIREGMLMPLFDSDALFSLVSRIQANEKEGFLAGHPNRA